LVSSTCGEHATNSNVRLLGSSRLSTASISLLTSLRGIVLATPVGWVRR
jgi:hypothetical protein